MHVSEDQAAIAPDLTPRVHNSGGQQKGHLYQNALSTTRPDFNISSRFRFSSSLALPAGHPLADFTCPVLLAGELTEAMRA